MAVLGYRVYQLTQALFLHFNTPKYDFITYHGKTKVTHKTWYARNDRFFFETLGKKFDTEDKIIDVLISYFVSGNTHMFARSILDHANSSKFINWKKNIQSLENCFRNDIRNIKKWCIINKVQFKDLFISENGQSPKIINLLYQDELNLETLCIINQIVSFTDKLDMKEILDPVCKETVTRVLKYSRFIDIDVEKYKKLLIETYKKD